MSWWHWAIVLVVLVVLFGSKKLPDAARGLGRSMRIFKSEIKEMQSDGKPDEASDDTDDSPRPISPPSTVTSAHDADEKRRSA